MNYIVRKTLFICFVLLFIIAAPTLVLYAQGYRLNLPYTNGAKLIVKTGGLFLKVDPKQADIYINGNLSKQTDFFFGSSLIENLLPRKYSIEVKKAGYKTWSKDLEIREKEVTEARNILLFPEKIAFSRVEGNVVQFLETNDQTKIALQEQNADGWNLRLYDLASGITTKLAGEGDFSAKDATMAGWEWIDGSQTLKVPVITNGKTINYSIATDKSPAKITRLENTATKNSTTTTELATDTAEDIIYKLMPDGYIYKKPTQGQAEKTSEAKMEIDPATNYKLWVIRDHYFVKKGAELYVLIPGASNFKKIFDSLVSEPEISPDGKKVVYSSNSEVWVFFLEGKTDQPIARAGDNEFIIRLSEKISDCHWLNSDHLIFIAGQTVKAAETDIRDRVNIVELTKISDITGIDQLEENARLFWDNTNKSVYIFANKSLYRSTPIE